MAIVFLTPAVFTLDRDSDGGGATPAMTVSVIIRLIEERLGFLVLTTALSGIYQTTLYHFAASRAVPPEFAGADLDHAFPEKKSRR